MEFLNAFLTVVLVLVSLFMILLVLMQRGNAAGGLGAAMGGGMAESALGAETSSVLSRWTRNTAIVFFVLAFGLYLSKLYQYENAEEATGTGLPQIESAQGQPSATSALQELMSQSEEAAATAEETAESVAEQNGAAEEPSGETPAPAVPAE